jgi:hypothetical protein
MLFVGLFAASPALARTIDVGSDTRVSSGSIAADVLHSAFYLRASGRDYASPAASSQELTVRLQRHFDVVLAALLANDDRSLDVALNRLQHARGELWTDGQRSAWRQTLAHRRMLNIRRLRLYQVRGLFPQNEHTAGRAVPIFVDNHDTACAVGHLMRESGWGDAVAAIERANNFVYVTDVRDGSLVDWVLVSGLTQEEAALIQPSYYADFARARLLEDVTEGSSITKNGLRFDNFHFIAAELSDPDSFPDVIPPNQVPLDHYGATVQQGVYRLVGDVIDPAFNDWLFFGARLDEYDDIYSIGPFFTQPATWGVLVSYDVTPVDPQHRLVAASLGTFRPNANSVWNDETRSGRLEIDVSIYASGTTPSTPLAALAFDAFPPTSARLTGEDSASFGPQQKITVVTTVKLTGAAMFNSIVHSFQVVPEPASAGLAGWACAVAVGLRRRSLSNKTAPW